MNTLYVYLDGIDMYMFVVLVVVAYLGFFLATAAWFSFRKEKKRPLKECAECGPGASNFPVSSRYDKNKKICPDCWDKEEREVAYRGA
ncbi:MAG: hypothetical protein AAB598_01100 [Patescibacteria group bacterium]